MKLKKLLALALSSAMVLSSAVAFAEVTTEEHADYELIMTSAPTIAEIQARRPELSVTATKLNTQAEVKSASTIVWSNQHKIESFDVYKLDFTVSNLGKVFNGYNNSDTRVAAGMGAFNMILPVTGWTDIFPTSTGKSQDGGMFYCNQDATYVIAQWSNSSASNPYPYLDEANELYKYEENGSYTATALVAFPVGTKGFTIENITGKVVYNVNGVNTDATMGSVQSSLTIGTVEEEEDAKLAVSAEDTTPANANGYIWDVTVTKGEGGALAAFDALFTDKDGNTAERTIRKGLETLNGKLTATDGNGSVAFKVGLKTAREIASAKFTVTDVADATATWPAAN